MYYLSQIIEQALLMYPLVLGIYVSFSVLKIADLTVDGSFLLGAAVFACMSTNGMPVIVSMVLAVAAGSVAGIICALIQCRNRLDPLIVGILMAFILHSLSLVVMARPNISLLNSGSVFSMAHSIVGLPSQAGRVVTLVAMLTVVTCFLSALLSARYGLWLKAFGNNQNLVALLGKNPESLRMGGLALGNGLAAFSGCLTAQASGYADINMGFGQALIGIAMILIGKEILAIIAKSDHMADGIILGCVFLGAAIYFLLTNELIRYGLDPVYLKMAIGVFLIGFLVLSSKREVVSRGFSS